MLERELAFLERDAPRVSRVAAKFAAIGFRRLARQTRAEYLGALAVGSPVNLERAVSAGRPMGGHYVQGHVDATVTVRSRAPDGDALELWFDAPPGALRYVVPKGFVTVDGASLTVVETDASGFSVTIVPHTRANVTFGEARPGYVANLEVDVMAKYIDRALDARLEELEARIVALETG